MLTLSFAWLFAVAVLICRALRQRAIFREIDEPARAVLPTPQLTVIVPARDEERNIGPCLESLTTQDYPRECFRVIVVDDNSTDATAGIAATFKSRGVELIKAPPLPAGWTGKSRACWIGAASAPADSEWLCFIDADIVASAALIPAAAAAALSEGIGFLSLAPKQRFVSFAERLVMPCGFYLLAFSQDLCAVNSPHRSEAAATGMFMLIRRDAYRAIGGHEAVRGEICEDVALARLAKKHGYKTVLLGGGKFLSTRMYTGWPTLWPGITKNLTAMLGGPALAVAAALIALALGWIALLLPLYDALRCQSSEAACIALAAAAPASAAAFALHLAGTAYFGIPFWYGLLFPLGYTVGGALAIDSVRRSLTGKISWKGRTYP